MYPNSFKVISKFEVCLRRKDFASDIIQPLGSILRRKKVGGDEMRRKDKITHCLSTEFKFKQKIHRDCDDDDDGDDDEDDDDDDDNDATFGTGGGREIETVTGLEK